MADSNLRRLRVWLNGKIVASVEEATTHIARGRGLLGRDTLAAGDGLLIRPCNSIHTCFMRFPIDIAFIAKDGHITKCVHNLRPFRCAWGGRRAHAALELSAGSLARAGALPGQLLRFENTVDVE